MIINLGTKIGKGSRKKDAEREACLDACTKLDSRNLLTSTESILTEAEKRKRRNELFGDTEGDDDNFYDRTSNSSKKKGVATLAGRKEKPVTETLSTLTQKRDTARKELDALKAAISKLEEGKNLAVSKDDELDSFMSAMQSAAQEKELKQKRAQIPVLEKVNRLILCCIY